MKKWASSLLLTPFVLGVLTFAWGFAVDYTNLRAEHSVLVKKQTSIEDQVREIHWYLIGDKKEKLKNK